MIEPGNATFEKVEWTTSNSDIIDVVNNNFVIKGTGKVTLTAGTYDNISSSITLNVFDVSDIYLAVGSVIVFVSLLVYIKVKRNKNKT